MAVRTWVRRPELWVVAGIVVLAFGARLAWALYCEAHPTDGRFDDSLLYHFLAIGIRDHFDYDNPFTGVPTGTWPPGYPAFLAGVYAVFGASVTAAKVVQCVVGAATVGLVYVLGRQLFDRPTAIAGALVAALMPGLIFFTGILWSEVLFTLLFMLALVAIAALPRRPANERLAWAAATGLVITATAYVRETGASLLLVAAVYWGWSLRDWRPALRFAGVGALLLVLLVLPWTVRNTAQLEGVIALSSSTGMNFWRGHHEGATGGFDDIEPLLERSKPRDEPGGEADANRRGLREGLEFALTNPVEEVELLGAKIRLLYQGDRIGIKRAEDGGRESFLPDGLRTTLNTLADAYYYAVLLLGGVAMLRWWREGGSAPLLLVLTVAVVTLGYVAFWGDPRFHYPLLPVFCLLAGWAVAWVVSRPSQIRDDRHL